MTFDAIYSQLESYCDSYTGAPPLTEDMTAELTLTGEGEGTMNLRVLSGKPILSRGAMPDSEFGIRVSSDDLVALLAGQLNPVNAYMSGRIKVRGNIAKLIKLFGALGRK